MSQHEISPDTGTGTQQNGSASAQAIGFITEFNANAAIFNNSIRPLLDSIGTSSETDSRDIWEYHERLARRVATLEGRDTADDPDFMDCAHVAPGQPCFEK